MFDSLFIAFATLFATVGPVDVALLYTALTPGVDATQRRTMAIKGVAIATGILLVIALFGQALLSFLGISLPALRIAGGILLLLLAIDMVFARQSGANSTTAEEEAEAVRSKDVSVFPLATPLIAGPGAMGAAILLVADTHGDVWRIGQVVIAIGLMMALTLALLLVADRTRQVLGVTGLNVITRVSGVLLAALSVQFILDGLGAIGLIPPLPRL